jgi:dephospho-CoA kinase
MHMIVGLTGGICSGKTEAERVLVKLGVRVLNADEIARFLTDHDPVVRAQIESRFSNEVFTRYGALDRVKLGSRVFASAVERFALEGILHPRILELQNANIDAARRAGQPLVISAPLLIESGAYQSMDRVVLIACTTELQEERLMRRAQLSREDAQRRIAAQLPLDAKQKLADIVLSNNGSLAEFQAAVRVTFLTLFDQEAHA